MIKITDEAKVEICKKIAEHGEADKVFVRLVSAGFNCCMPKFNLEFDTRKYKADIETVVDGIKIVYDVSMIRYLGEVHIAYNNFWFSKGFYVSGLGKENI